METTPTIQLVRQLDLLVQTHGIENVVGCLVDAAHLAGLRHVMRTRQPDDEALDVLARDLTVAYERYCNRNGVHAVVGRIFLTDHPANPDLQLGLVWQHRVVVGRHYEPDQLGVFIPAGCVLEEDLLREMWLWNDELGKGRLGGKKGDRVKVRHMDGYRSDGLFYGHTYCDVLGVRRRSLKWRDHWKEGDHVEDALGVTCPKTKGGDV